MIPHTLQELEQVRLDCRTLVNTRAKLSAGVAILPLLGVDLAVDTGLLVEMVSTINRRFGLSAEQIEKQDTHVRSLLLLGIGAVGSELVGRAITRPLLQAALRRVSTHAGSKVMTRFIPLLGQALSAGISYSAMRAFGNAHIEDCHRVVERVLVANLPEKMGITRSEVTD